MMNLRTRILAAAAGMAADPHSNGDGKNKKSGKATNWRKSWFQLTYSYLNTIPSLDQVSTSSALAKATLALACPTSKL